MREPLLTFSFRDGRMALTLRAWPMFSWWLGGRRGVSPMIAASQSPWWLDGGRLDDGSSYY